MSFIRQILGNAAIGVGVGVAEQPESLDVIRHPGVAAAIWKRKPLVSFQTWIDRLDPALLPKARVILRPGHVRRAVYHLAEAAGMPDVPERQLLVDDVAALAGIFAELMETPFLRLRLDVVTGDACRRFHIDAVTARLVCTYRGRGTQYGISMDGEEPVKISSVPAGSPMILKGTRWPGEMPSGLLHRSPPIEGTGETRLLLVLDPVGADEAEEIKH